jgi:putative colanic acid biosynthesis acetyltransferase WcaF
MSADTAQRTRFHRARLLGERAFNIFVTHVPSHWVRQRFLRLLGASIGQDTSIFMGTTVLGPENLVIGDNCSIGFRCVLDARGGLVIDECVVIASDTQVITAQHLVHSDDFAVALAPTHIQHHVWLASRATVLQGVTVGAGAVVAACALVREDVAPMEIVGGVPATSLGFRTSALEYRPKFRPPLY